ncbi:hypothetical protein WOLCODRAFT_26483 [Wolfiporia cocos MD-104 SS10]|uniref:Velvet domain-containing protein n=1 Tax=Wolfiporia cocos (strain MD-104) TaxID=742152 RepID=A0A2H3JQ84_WOLCO|nr:hypothetical protein WOLCODRAFT_26483 [Wolfiporia cocos MD-104 SS10]
MNPAGSLRPGSRPREADCAASSRRPLRTPSAMPPRPVVPISDAKIGRPVAFAAGPYAGRTIRAELDELQKADVGRKYGRKDRRPIDPPPVVQLRLFELDHAGVEREIERYDDVKTFGVMCHVDLFPVPPQDEDGAAASDSDERNAAAGYPQSHSANMYAPAPSALPPHPPPAFHTRSAPQANPYYQRAESSSSSRGPYGAHYPSPSYFPHSPTSPHAKAPPSPEHTSRALPERAPRDPDVVAYLDGFPIRESAANTGALIGAKFVQTVALEHKGRNALMFVFPDLAVKDEGTFVLRYRVFDLFSLAAGDAGVPVLAECFGGPFRIYSTKDFPGLRRSTDLTKHLALYGVRLNFRTHKRKRLKQCEIEESARRTAAAGARGLHPATFGAGAGAGAVGHEREHEQSEGASSAEEDELAYDY